MEMVFRVIKASAENTNVLRCSTYVDIESAEPNRQHRSCGSRHRCLCDGMQAARLNLEFPDPVFLDLS